MRWSYDPPQYHKIPHLRRGIALHADVYICFTAYQDNEQEESGDTLTHTFVKTDWPSCYTRWFYFWGTQAGLTCVSTSPVFELHYLAPPTDIYNPTWHNRTITSIAGNWNSARYGTALKVDWNYYPPNLKNMVSTSLNASFGIARSWLNFNTPPVPTGKKIVAGRVALYVIQRIGQVSSLCLTKGLILEPIEEDSWYPQTAETLVLGSIFFSQITPNAYNWIPLNQDGIDWINHSQHEYKEQEGVSHYPAYSRIFYGNNRQCMSFKPRYSHLNRIFKLRLKQKNADGYFFLGIYRADDNGYPTGDLIAQCSRPAALVSPNPNGAWFRMIFAEYIEFFKDTNYCFVLWYPGGNPNKWVAIRAETHNRYPLGQCSYSTDGGNTWTADPNYDANFIEYETRYLDIETMRVSPSVGGTNFCLRTSHDVNDIPPIAGQVFTVHYYCAQAGWAYKPRLELTLQDI